MKYRITEFAIKDPTTGNRFFVEIAEGYQWVKKRWFCFTYWKRLVPWEKQGEGFKTMKDAMDSIRDIKKMEPIYHEIA